MLKEYKNPILSTCSPNSVAMTTQTSVYSEQRLKWVNYTQLKLQIMNAYIS